MSRQLVAADYRLNLGGLWSLSFAGVGPPRGKNANVTEMQAFAINASRRRGSDVAEPVFFGDEVDRG